MPRRAPAAGSAAIHRARCPRSQPGARPPPHSDASQAGMPAEALLERVARADPLPAINLYNAISVANALPLGGEDLDRVHGDVILTPATGDEDFDGDEPPRPGEII
jgi:DNA/RNA-binding domain of Phe-tRNA-synthetase-like protein